MASSYTAYESADDEAKNGVEALCRHLTKSGEFDATTSPLLEEVERYINISHFWIQGLLQKAGLSTTQTDTDVIGILEQLNVYDTCVKVELGQPALNVTGEPNARFVAFTERRDELMAMVVDGTLSAMGATADSIAAGRRTPILTGQLISRKKVADGNTDRTQHSVRRGAFVNPAIAAPRSETDRN